MAYFFKNEHDSKDVFGHLYNGIQTPELAQNVHKLLSHEGYRLSTGQPGNGVYEKGNRILRILFGAFIKYFKWTVLTADAGDGLVRVKVSRETSGMSGGLIGMNQVKNEFTRMKAIFAGL